jgi:hypothetical protein
MMDDNVKIRLRHLIEDVDRHGNVRCYVRLPGMTKVRIRGTPGSEEFMAAYHVALAGAPGGQRQARAAARGSFRYVCQKYFGSAAFKESGPCNAGVAPTTSGAHLREAQRKAGSDDEAEACQAIA